METAPLSRFEFESNHIVDSLRPIQPRHCGILTRIVGLTLEASGLTASVGSVCRILKKETEDDYVDDFRGSMLAQRKAECNDLMLDPLHPDDALSLRQHANAYFDALVVASDIKYGRLHPHDEVIALCESPTDTS